jgi:peroxiredoxin
MRSDIVPGGVFPDYGLPDHTGTVRTLSELQGRDPLILTLARGNYCPKEHQQHLELAANYPKIAVAYTQVATIATDDHHTLQEFRASVGAQWTFLSDPGRTVQQDLDIAEYTDPEHKTSCSVPPRARARSAIMVPIVDLPLFLRSAAGLCGRARPGGLVPRSSSSCPRSQSFSHTLERPGRVSSQAGEESVWWREPPRPRYHCPCPSTPDGQRRQDRLGEGPTE